jgi:aldehyde reductase
MRILPLSFALPLLYSSSNTMKRSLSATSFRATATGGEAQSLTDGVQLSENVIMPWVGYGTYRLGKGKAYKPTLDALKAGYRCIDTAFIYAGEHTEKQVGEALQTALKEKVIGGREDVFVLTKHWRKYHGYDKTTECLNLSLKRLKLDYVDLYLIHWPGPAYSTMSRRSNVLDEQGPWAYATTDETDMVSVRAETWRAMEDAMQQGKIKAIGVSNFTIRHLKTLKKTAKIWPPAVNQVECHPLYPNNELREYCEKEGIVLQAYAVLGGQDGTRKKWKELLDGKKLIECPDVLLIGEALGVTPAQVLLRYALQRNCAVTPKTTSPMRMEENANIFHFKLSDEQMAALNDLEVPGEAARLCWRTDPLRLLDFE